ncbi:Uncharacterised protein [Bordetella trematum]|nr:Uncharacterised protein [Bordetella trematum]
MDPNIAAMPRTMGMNSNASVQTAPTPITPAPMKRTCVLQMCVPNSARLWPAAGADCNVSTGTATPQAISSPVSMARPATMPIR